MVGVQPRRVQLVVARRAAEIPDVWLAVSREQRIARELVARPLADHRAGGVADIVLVEREQRAETGVRERGAHAREAVPVQPAEIDARSEEHTSELQSPCNLVCRLLLEKKKQH